MRTLLLTALFVVFVLPFSIFGLADAVGGDYEIKADSVVKIYAERGHGSAVHIGNGYYLTAAHVTGDRKEMKIKTALGDEGTASVLWASKQYDIALVKSGDPLLIGTANLDCRELENGEAIWLKGNPLNLEFITTSGFVAGAELSLGPWKAARPVDASLAGGMSGGPVFDAEGKLVGINVGGMVQRMGMGGSFVGISYIVPSSAICGLMGLLV